MKRILFYSLLLLAVVLMAGCAGNKDQKHSELPEDEKAKLLEICRGYSSLDAGTANVAPRGFAMAGSCKNGDGFSNLNANDGDKTTGFSTKWDSLESPDDAYIFIDLKEVYELTEIKLYPMKGYESLFPVDFDVLVSEDGNNYTVADSKTGADGSALSGGCSSDVSGKRARFVRIKTNKLSSSSETGAAVVLSEIEIYAKLDTAHNITLNRDSMWMYLSPASAQQLKANALSVNNGGKDVTFLSDDENIVSVTADGYVTAKNFGETVIYAYDGVNLTKCPVKVLDDSSDFRISVFYHSSFGHPDIVRDAFDYIKEAGIDYIEETRTYDRVGNDISMYHVFLCSERGLFYSPCDVLGDDNVLTMSDDEIRNLVKKYENMAGFSGLYLQDEPHEEFTQYAHVCRVISEYNPHVTPHLNLLPPYNFDGAKEYFTDFAATAGGAFRYRYLSYDHYPFGAAAGSFNNQIYESLNSLRKTGLKYNAATGFYMQAMGIKGNYRVLNERETLYNATIGIAYGIKNFKWFVGLTPISSSEAFTTGLIGPDYKPGEMYEYVKSANAAIRSAEAVLASCDAIEVYHTGKMAGNDTLPKDFVLHPDSKYAAIYTLYRSSDESAQQYIVVSNTNFTSKKGKDLSFELAGGLSSLEVYENGAFKTVEISDGSFECHVDAGSFVIFRLPAGFDASSSAEPSDNLALNNPAFVSTSAVGFWARNGISAGYLTDGETGSKMWTSLETDSSPEVLVDLKSVCDIGKISLRSLSENANISIYISTDGVKYDKIDVVKSGDDYTFDSVQARYVRISFGIKGKVSVSEIEIYR